MSTFKQERIDGVVREIERKSLQEIAMIILDLRFNKRVIEYERDWLDELANALRDGYSFNEMELMQELYTNQKKELIEQYMNK